MYCHPECRIEMNKMYEKDNQKIWEVLFLLSGTNKVDGEEPIEKGMRPQQGIDFNETKRSRRRIREPRKTSRPQSTEKD